MDLTEKKISSKELYRSPSYTFTLDTVRLPDGREHTREVFHHPGGVAVLAINEKGQVIVEHQYRYAVRQTILEIPAGKMDKIPGEKPEETALRELREETGYIAKEMTFLGKIYTSPGVMSEVLYFYLARGLSREERELDEDEFLTVEWMGMETLLDKIAKGEIMDCKMISAFFFAKLKGYL
jgi:ADP-ribose pyrophosphatase